MLKVILEFLRSLFSKKAVAKPELLSPAPVVASEVPDDDIFIPDVDESDPIVLEEADDSLAPQPSADWDANAHDQSDQSEDVVYSEEEVK